MSDKTNLIKEEGYAVPEREATQVLMDETTGYCEALEQEVRELSKEVKRQRRKQIRYIIYTALIAAFYSVIIFDVERNVICDRKEVICLEWEKRDGSPRN